MFKNLHKWILPYIVYSTRGAVWDITVPAHVTHIIFACCDHFEPNHGDVSLRRQISRVERWADDFPRLSKKYVDADGHSPKQTFFYPAEEYKRETMDRLEPLVEKDFAEVEIHLHHDGDTEQIFKEKIREAMDRYAAHGFLARRKVSGRLQFGFIHGNWALNNSRPDGKWCGVNNESSILHDLGCYADFTYPSAPSITQPPFINRLYYAGSTPDKPAGHTKGVVVRVGQPPPQDKLMMIQGPLGLNFINRSRGIFPRIENGDISENYHPTPDRVELWINLGISVRGKHNWIFIKTHTHGAKERNADVLLGRPMENLYDYLMENYSRGRYKMHFVTAREMYNIIKAAEAGETGNPGLYRDYILKRNQ